MVISCPIEDHACSSLVTKALVTPQSNNNIRPGVAVYSGYIVQHTSREVIRQQLQDIAPSVDLDEACWGNSAAQSYPPTVTSYVFRA